MNRTSITIFILLVFAAITTNQSRLYIQAVSKLSETVYENECRETYANYASYGIKSILTKNQPSMLPVLYNDEYVQITGELLLVDPADPDKLQYNPDYRGAAFFAPVSKYNLRTINLQKDMELVITKAGTNALSRSKNTTRRSLMLAVERMELWGFE